MTDDLRSRLTSAVHSYRRTRNPEHLAVLNAAGLGGIARALEQEATAQPGIQRDDATARINGWLHTPTPTAGRHGDQFGLGGSDPTR